MVALKILVLACGGLGKFGDTVADRRSIGKEFGGDMRAGGKGKVLS